jgi:hypothetical protein
MNRSALHLAQLALAGWCALAAATPAVAYEYTSVEYPGALGTSLWGLNNSGTATGTAALADGISTAGFTLDTRKGTLTTLDETTPGGYPFSPLGINEAGMLAGPLAITDEVSEGATRDKQAGYATFSIAGYATTVARAIGPSGLVSGYAIDDSGAWTGFLHDSKSGADTLFLSGSPQVIPQGTNGRGLLVGSVALPADGAFPGSPAGQYGFVREPDDTITLFRVNGLPTRARGLNDSGTMVGFLGNTATAIGFVLPAPRGGGYRDLTAGPEAQLMVPDAAGTVPQSINNAGVVVGQWFDTLFNGIGFVATPTKPKGK